MLNNIYQSEYTGPQMDSKFSAVATLQEAVAALETAVAAKYSKPDGGIPSTDMDADVQAALALALTAVQSLADYYTKAQVDAIAAAIASAVNSTSGVTVTTLPSASADTLGKIYYVGPDGNGEYARKVTSYDGTTYSWLDLGTTAIDLTQYATKAELNQLDQEVARVVDLDAIPYADYTLKADGSAWGSGSKNKHIFLKVNVGEVYKIVANSTNQCTYALMTDATVSPGQAVHYVSGTSRVDVPAGTTFLITIPATCEYLFFYSGTTDNSGSGRQSLPDSVKLIKGINVVVGDNKTRLDKIDGIIPLEFVYGNTNASNINASNGTLSSGNNRAYCEYIDIHNLHSITYSRPVSTSASTVWGMAFYDSNKSYISGQAAKSGASANGYEKTVLEVPYGAYYARFSRWIDETLGDFYLLDSGAIRQKAEALGVPGDILTLNPESEFQPKMMAAKKRFYTTTDASRPQPFVIAHLSDIHANWGNVVRFLRFADFYKNHIDLLVNTGDTVDAYYADGIAGYSAIDGAEDILIVTGNHDTRGDSAGMAQWTDHVGVDAYNMLIKPFVSGWGVQQPTGAEGNGYCYYYKDDSTRKLRLIFVDIMGYDATQDAWVQELLASAITNEYAVLIVTHFPPARPSAEATQPAFSKVDCNYTTLYPYGGSSEQLTGYNENSYLLAESVADFMEGGGDFIGYLCGHYHADIVAKLGKYPDQMAFHIGPSKAGEMRDYNHVRGTRDNDEFQIVSIDTTEKTITLYKVGANVDKYCRHKNAICVDYDTHTVKCEAY